MIYLGTAGWAYKHWGGVFYPRNIESELGYYSKYSQMTEINTTFYQLPSITRIRIWYHYTPDEFIFSAKLSRQITHSSRYDDKSELLEGFFNRMQELEEKFKIIVIQFPPHFRRTSTTENYLSHILNKSLELFTGQIVVELRNNSWFTDNFIIDLFQRKQITLVDTTKLSIPGDYYRDSPIYYIRIIGDRHEMPDELLGTVLLDKKNELEQRITQLKSLSNLYQQIFVVINNRFSGYAINDAIRIQRALNKEGIDVVGFEKHDKFKQRHMTLSEFL